MNAECANNCGWPSGSSAPRANCSTGLMTTRVRTAERARNSSLSGQWSLAHPVIGSVGGARLFRASCDRSAFIGCIELGLFFQDFRPALRLNWADARLLRNRSAPSRSIGRCLEICDPATQALTRVALCEQLRFEHDLGRCCADGSR